MPLTLLIQNDFTHGELDPKMKSKVDLSAYYKAAEKLRNVSIFPQGGAQRRCGTQFIADLGVVTENEYILREFNFKEEEKFLLVFTNLQVEIYDSTDSVVATVVTPFTSAQLKDVKTAQDSKRMILTHPDVAPQVLLKQAILPNWSMSDFEFTFLPTLDFDDNYDAVDFSLSAVTIGQPRTLTASANIFTTEHVGGVFIAAGATVEEPIGVARIISFTSALSVEVDITTVFSPEILAPKVIIGKKVSLQEVAFSTTRGWPISVTFYEDRLWFGGTKEVPNVLFASKIGDIRDFDEAAGADPDDAIGVILSSEAGSSIEHLQGDRVLYILTDNSTWVPPQFGGNGLESPLSVRKQTNVGASSVRPQLLDNQLIYVRRGGQGIESMTFTDNVDAFDGEEISLLSPQLIRDPVDATVIKEGAINGASFLYVVNSDGTIASFQSRKVENVSAWTMYHTQQTFEEVLDDDAPVKGKFKRIQAVGQSVYLIVQRIIDGNTQTFLEKFNSDSFVDSGSLQTFGLATDTITGLDHLEGEEVRVKGDDFVLLNQTVVGGQITIEREVTKVQVGLDYNPLIVTLPLNVSTPAGSNFYLPKTITRAFIDFFESLGILVRTPNSDQDERILFLEFGDTINDPPEPKTDFSVVRPFGNWDVRQNIIIRQIDPYPLFITGIGFEVE